MVLLVSCRKRMMREKIDMAGMWGGGFELGRK